MTQEDKELLIKDLCIRLPYKVWFKIGENPIKTYDYVNDILMSIDIINEVVNNKYYIGDIKPYLFPISSMIEEQKNEYFDVCWKDWIDNKSKDISAIEVLYKTTDWLNARHFDYRGLIEKGLALDATNLNIY